MGRKGKKNRNKIKKRSNYLRGRRFEYELKKKLEKEGWVVLRTAGSHGFADLICVKDGKVKFLQLSLRYEKNKAKQIEEMRKRLKVDIEYIWKYD